MCVRCEGEGEVRVSTVLFKVEVVIDSSSIII